MSSTHIIFKQLEEQAQKGIAAAQYQLALAYEAGDGVPKDEKKAFEWMKES
ncbi:MAG: SEL1-like repeat protein, partial [Selenomonadaceae bacterium]|nr:SEL1-like repeat protein [Selenomonadaceae bacterium]